MVVYSRIQKCREHSVKDIVFSKSSKTTALRIIVFYLVALPDSNVIEPDLTSVYETRRVERRNKTKRENNWK